MYILEYPCTLPIMWRIPGAWGRLSVQQGVTLMRTGISLFDDLDLHGRGSGIMDVMVLRDWYCLSWYSLS